MARDVAGCEQMMRALVPGFPAVPEPELGEMRVGLAWLSDADPLVRARVEEAAALFGTVEPVALPFPEDTYAQFAFEAAGSHRDLYAAHRERYSENLQVKLDAAVLLTEDDAVRAARARERYREQVAEAIEGLDLLVTPTLEMVAPASGIGDLALRGRMIRLTYPFNATGAPALALPAGPAEDGLPASVQLVGRPGEDALVLAAGHALERALRPR